MLVPEWRNWAMDQLGLADLVLTVDLFATPWTTAAPFFVTKEMDAFSFDWGQLLLSEAQCLWANPPFALLSKVVAKLQEDRCRVMLVTPQREDKPWWVPLSRLAKSFVVLPPRHRIFLGGFRKEPLPQKDWKTLVWFIDTTDRIKITVTPPSNQSTPSLRGFNELLEENSKIPQFQWSHAHRGGKGASEARKPECADVGTQTADKERVAPLIIPQDPVVAECEETPRAFIRGGLRTLNQDHHKREPTGGLNKLLRVDVVLHTLDGIETQASALVDTGAEVSIVRTGLLPEKCFSEAKRRVRLLAANNARLDGGTQEVELEVRLNARDLVTRDKLIIGTATTLYQVDIEEDVILSYRWLAEREFSVNPRQHGLNATVGDQKLWIPGINLLPKQRANARLPREPAYLCTVPQQRTAPNRKKGRLICFVDAKAPRKCSKRMVMWLTA